LAQPVYQLGDGSTASQFEKDRDGPLHPEVSRQLARRRPQERHQPPLPGPCRNACLDDPGFTAFAEPLALETRGS
jgi:hypothetical protein